MYHHSLADARQGSDIHAAHAQKRAKLYEGILARFLAGTGLEHPFIHQVVLEAVTKREGD